MDDRLLPRTVEVPARLETHGRWILRAVVAAATFYIAAAMAAIFFLSPRVPYADVWRFLHRLLSQPFPGNILVLDNGHREVLPNLLRYFELQMFSGSQQLQIAAGAALLLVTLWLWWGILRRTALPAAVNASAFLCIVIGLCWLGNFRALVHGNESVHAYLVTCFLTLGIGCLVRSDSSGASWVGKGLLAGTCGLLATLSFGSGISSFVAFFIVLALMRSPPRQWLLVAAFLVPSAFLASGSGHGLNVSPGLQSEVLLRWISAPWIYAGWPLLDAEIAGRLPSSLAAYLLPVSRSAIQAFGPVMTARWPHLLLGIAGTVWLVHTTWRCSRRNDCAPAIAGVALAWFAFTVGGLVAIARLAYFENHPDQVLAPRYVVWSSLFWAGLAFASVTLTSRRLRGSLAILAVAVALLPSQAWMWKLAAGIPAVAEPAAVAAAVGTVDPDFSGENVSHEVAAAIPSLRAAGAAMFAWEESKWLGRTIEEHSVQFIAMRVVSSHDIDEATVPGARRLQMALSVAHPGDRFLLIDSSGLVKGLAIRDRRDSSRVLGWTLGMEDETPRLAALSR